MNEEDTTFCDCECLCDKYTPGQHLAVVGSITVVCGLFIILAGVFYGGC